MTGKSIARAALLCNAAFSAVCGLVLAVEGGTVARELFVRASGGAWMLVALGVGLIGFAAFLAWTATRPGLGPRQVLTFTAMDVTWVLGTLATLGLAAGAFTPAGVAATALVGLAVGVFATGQGVGAARME
jgi:hypothetical protein